MSITLDIRLKKANKVYHEGECVSGCAVITSPTDVKHDGLTLQLEGIVNLQLSSKNVGIFEAFYNSVKPISLININLDLANVGRIPAGVTEIPFEIPLVPKQAPSANFPRLLETYHGVFINVSYILRCHMKRSFLNKPLNANCMFVIQFRPDNNKINLNPVRCLITPQSVLSSCHTKGDKSDHKIPHFIISAELNSSVCSLDKPFTGQICVKECAVSIKSIELQLVRVETCGCSEGYARDATEIQNIQLGEGDVFRGINIPIYMIFPRLFTCPTTTTTNFKIEFEVNIAIIFQDDYLVTENFPIVLVRN